MRLKHALAIASINWSAALTTDEAREVMNIARRIASILLLEPSLDTNYQAIKTATYLWPSS